MNSSPSRSSSLSSISLDQLWIVTVLILAWLFISVLPLPPNDLWWHMAAGRSMVQQGALLHTNQWAYTLPAHAPYVYQSWLSEVVMYGLWRLGDVPALTLARTLAIVTSYAFIAWHAWRRTRQGKVVALTLLLAILVGWNNWTLRPQTLALLPGAAFAALLGEYLGGRVGPRWLIALPPLMVLWANMHGSFALGLALIGLSVLGTAITAMRCPPSKRGLAWRHCAALALAACATLAAVLLTPLGFGMGGYVRTMLTNSALQRSFIEWQPPRNTFDLTDTGFWFFAMLLLLAVLMASSPRRPSATDVLWYVGLSWLAIGGVRYAIWYALLLLPLLAEQLAALLPPRRPLASQPGFTIAYGALLGAAMIAVLPWFSPGRYLGSNSASFFARSGPYRMLLGSSTPVTATAWLASHPLAGHFWVEMSYSSYTIWALPDKQVFADLRVELFPDNIWRDYFIIAAGDERSLARIEYWGITHLLIDTSSQEKLYTLLRHSPGWCERFSDTRAVVMARCAAGVQPPTGSAGAP